MTQISLRNYDNSWYHPGRSAIWRMSWFFLGLPILRSLWIPSSSLRVHLLRLFGARIGERVVVKPGVSVKYPWHLIVGDDSWIGERCWIDNLTTVRIGTNVCLSQGAYLCTGNHDWKDPSFRLMVAPIQLYDGSWAGAMCVLTPGVVLEEGAIAAAGSVVIGNIPTCEIHAGNPAVFVKKRHIETVGTMHLKCEASR
jgi:putative colanic acid biosynthesis acetyltransferase WcaF